MTQIFNWITHYTIFLPTKIISNLDDSISYWKSSENEKILQATLTPVYYTDNYILSVFYIKFTCQDQIMWARLSIIPETLNKYNLVRINSSKLCSVCFTISSILKRFLGWHHHVSQQIVRHSVMCFSVPSIHAPPPLPL